MRNICKRILVFVLVLGLLITLGGCRLLDLPSLLFPESEWEETMPSDADQTRPPVTQPQQQQETTQPTTEPELVVYWVRAEGGLNVRRGPGQSYEAVGRLENGAKVIPLAWQDGWAYVDLGSFVGWCSGDYLFDVSQVEIANDAILGRWCSPSSFYTDDGRFCVIFSNYWNFNADGTFTRTETESQWYFNLDGTEDEVLGAGALDSKGTFSFDGTCLTVTTTHRFESSSGPFIKLDQPETVYATIIFDGDTLLVDWGNGAARFYREYGDALVKRLLREQQ